MWYFLEGFRVRLRHLRRTTCGWWGFEGGTATAATGRDAGGADPFPKKLQSVVAVSSPSSK
jgi:hypothetical protein